MIAAPIRLLIVTPKSREAITYLSIGTRRTFQLIAMMIWSSAPCVGQTRTAEHLDNYVRKAMVEWRVPGTAIAVVKNDSIVFIRGYGVRATGTDAPVDRNTLFYGVVHPTQFVTAVTALLVDEGKVSWNDPVKKHLPAFTRPDPWVADHATIRDLLANRNSAGPSSAGGFRDQFFYSPADAEPVAELIRNVTGTSWTVLLQSRVLVPLAMNAYSIAELWNKEDLLPCYLCGRSGPPVRLDHARVRNIALGHYVSNDAVVPIAWPPRTLLDDFASAQSALDAAKWLRLNLGLGAYEGRQIISSASTHEIQAPQVVVRAGPYYEIPADVSELWSFGLEWFVGSYRGHKIVMRQTGLGSGFRSFIAMIPSLDMGVAVLSNANLRGAPANFPLAIGLRVIDAYLNAPARDWSGEYLDKARAAAARRTAEERRLESAHVKGMKPSLPLSAYSGVYASQRGDTMTVVYSSGLLHARRRSGATATLEHWHNDVFLFADTGPEKYRDNLGTFTVANHGRAAGVKTTFWGSFERVVDR